MRRQRCLFVALCALGGFYIIFYGVTFKNYFKPRYNYKTITNCDPIHIGVVCLKQNCKIVDLYAMLKAIYFYRNVPLNLHILIDNGSEGIVKTLFDTWTVSQVTVNMYHLNELPTNLHWMMNQSISVDLSKLVFPLVVSKNVYNLLVIDSDLFCIGDMDTLWRFHSKHSNQIEILSNEKWDSNVWLLKVNDLKTSELYKNFIYNVSYHREDAADFNLEHINLNVDHTYIDFRHIRCNKISHIQTINDFTPIHNVVMKFNVALLPDLTYCPRNETYTPAPKVDLKVCKRVPETTPTYYKYRTLLFIKDFEYDPKPVDVTMVTQMSFEKFPVFEIICRRWTGPISVALYLLEDELPATLSIINESKALKDRKNIAYHIMFKEGTYQPINKLRNLALRFVNTPYVFLNDVDFVPGPDLYSDIKYQIKSMKTMNQKALVIPAFSAVKEKMIMPVELKQMKLMWDKKQIIPFHAIYFPQGHKPTDYKKFKTAKKPYTVKWEPHYEPYVVVETSVVKYDERFVGYIWNKVQHIMELEASGYEFIVLPNTFLVHKYHERSADFRNIGTSKNYYPCIMQIKKLFVKEMNVKYKRKYVFKDFVI